MSARFSRNEALFGAEGQAKISCTSVGIVGLGGLGSHVAQQLAYLGVENFTLIDFDVVTDSSMNRLVGAVDADPADRTLKVAVAARVITAINPAAQIYLIDGALADPRSEPALAGVDVVFGCLDRDVFRIDLTELAARHGRVYFDLATDIHAESDEYGGRVVLCDGTRCLVCLPEVLNQRAIAYDRMNSEQQEGHRRIYGIDVRELDRSGPSVVSINGVVASLAVTEFMALVAELRPPAGQLTYRADIPAVLRSLDEPVGSCYYCTGWWRRSGMTNDHTEGE